MKFNNMFKKGQSLPLNTIVIAILVILVLVVIVVFFTTSVTNTGEKIESNSVDSCSVDTNNVLKTLGYESAQYLEEDDCKDRSGTVISSNVVSKNDDGEICCAWN